MFESFCVYNDVALPENDFILTLEFKVGPPGKDHKLLSQQSASSPPLVRVLSHIINAFTNANSLSSIIADTKIYEQICQRNVHFYSLLPSLLRTINQSLSSYQFTDRGLLFLCPIAPVMKGSFSGKSWKNTIHRPNLKTDMNVFLSLFPRTPQNTLYILHLHPKNRPTHHKNVSPAEM